MNEIIEIFLFDILNEFPKFVNNLFNLKRTKLEDIINDHKSHNNQLTQNQIVDFNPSHKDNLKTNLSLVNKLNQENNELQSLYQNPTVARETTPIDIAVQASKIFNDEKEFEAFTESKKKGDTAMRRIDNSGFQERDFVKSDTKAFLYGKRIVKDFGTD